jgi:hypothetical protein
MIYIAHRGLIDGPNEGTENSPKQVEYAISQGFDCEVDFWVVNYAIGPRFYLGHDYPQYVIEHDFILNKSLWIHAKNIQALTWLVNLSSKHPDLKYFWHQEDDFTLTSNRLIWTYPGKVLTPNSICVLNGTEYVDPPTDTVFGICSKFVSSIKKNTK